MKYLTSILVSLSVFACNTAPVIIPDTTKDNVVMRKLDWEIKNNSHLTTNWGWILWYLPVVFLVVVWAYNQYFKPPCKEEETVEKEETKTPKSE